MQVGGDFASTAAQCTHQLLLLAHAPGNALVLKLLLVVDELLLHGGRLGPCVLSHLSLEALVVVDETLLQRAGNRRCAIVSSRPPPDSARALGTLAQRRRASSNSASSWRALQLQLLLLILCGGATCLR